MLSIRDAYQAQRMNTNVSNKLAMFLCSVGMPVSPSRPDFHSPNGAMAVKSAAPYRAAGPEPRGGFSAYGKCEHGEDPPFDGHEHFGTLDQV
jgi:hypothetical protein